VSTPPPTDPRCATPPWDTPPTGPPSPATLRQYFRRRTSLSQHAVAKHLGCSQGYISMVVRGQRALRGKQAIRLAALTGVPIERLLVLARKPKPKKQPAAVVPAEGAPAFVAPGALAEAGR